MIVVFKSDLELALHKLIRLTDHFQRFSICSRCLRWTWRLDARAPSGILFQNSNQVHSEISTCAHAVSSFVVSMLYLWPFFTDVCTYKFSNINTSFLATFEVHKMFTCHSAQNVCDSWAFEAHLYNRLIYSKCKHSVSNQVRLQCVQPSCQGDLSAQPEGNWYGPDLRKPSRPRPRTLHPMHPGRSWTWDSSSTPWAHMAMAFVPWNKGIYRDIIFFDVFGSIQRCEFALNSPPATWGNQHLGPQKSPRIGCGVMWLGEWMWMAPWCLWFYNPLE